jgi:hypothetical protein
MRPPPPVKTVMSLSVTFTPPLIWKTRPWPSARIAAPLPLMTRLREMSKSPK